MKKILFLLATGLVSGNCIAQEILNNQVATPAAVTATDDFTLLPRGAAHKSTGLTDTLYFANTGQTTTTGYSASYYDIVTPVDSGRFFGMNKFGYKGFAQLYRFSSIDRTAPVDTTYNILGVMAAFGGTATSTSRSITMTLWRRGTNKVAIAGRPKFFIYGPPSTTVTGGTRTFTHSQIGINTLKAYYFTAPITGINYDLYAGYTIPTYSYTALGGDTIGLYSSPNPNGGNYTIETGTLDSLVSVNTLVQSATNDWMSPGFDPALFRGGDLVLFPLVQLSSANIKSNVGLTMKNMSFFGNYPNPANGNTNIKISLTTRTNVTITIMDVTGKTINTIEKNGLQAGTHVIPVNTASYAAGTYSYLVRTADGDGIGSQFTVAK
jgi:hypothetical protein